MCSTTVLQQIVASNSVHMLKLNEASVFELSITEHASSVSTTTSSSRITTVARPVHYFKMLDYALNETFVFVLESSF